MKKKLILVVLNFLSLIAFSQKNTNTNLQTLGNPVNTLESSEFAPTISADGNTLIFESDKGGRWRLYMTNQVQPGVWSKPVDIIAINNVVGPDDFLGGPCLSYDGSTLFFTSNMKGGMGGIDIWYSKRTGNNWSAPKNLGKPVNSAGYDGFPSLSPDGKILYFMRAGEKNTSTGQRCCNLFKATRQGAFFINPVPLPYPVNSGCEGYPRIMADGKTLIYSSYKSDGKGGYDLYESKFKYGKWTKPVPLDFINTAKDDELISVPASGDIIYLSSTTSNNKDDIYKVELPGEFRPEKVISVEGFIKDEETSKPIASTIQLNNFKTKEKVSEVINDSVTGKYQVYIEEGQTYDFSISSKGHTFHSEVLKSDSIKRYQKFEKSVKLKPLKKNTSFVLNNIFFEFDSSAISATSFFELDRVVDLMKVNKSLVVEISAHTDDMGSDDYNNKLSQNRAESVVRYLTSKGITAERLVAKGFGKTMPAVPNDSDENRAKNRRVEFKILKI
ncbi:MAG: PD40 domain-containing protein [Sporocytophaga sp.]|uniref:OmpA family protein n=1 Tax=Sporocytophaga sp. TaxID=2231183 RepID=UPI001B0C4B38|nr:OmpA family protein [Sporocytophaga sp.]MBO9703216.1 PD40 domain-containing protein [Sporocytophaga sp.]